MLAIYAIPSSTKNSLLAINVAFAFETSVETPDGSGMLNAGRPVNPFESASVIMFILALAIPFTLLSPGNAAINSAWANLIAAIV